MTLPWFSSPLGRPSHPCSCSLCLPLPQAHWGCRAGSCSFIQPVSFEHLWCARHSGKRRLRAALASEIWRRVQKSEPTIVLQQDKYICWSRWRVQTSPGEKCDSRKASWRGNPGTESWRKPKNGSWCWPAVNKTEVPLLARSHLVGRPSASCI